MNGEWPPCLFLVFTNPRPGGDEALARWYREVHGPDAFENPAFSALHRYRAVGDYDARYLAVWECAFASLEDARARIVPRAARLRDERRITDDLVVVWSSMHFRTGEPVPGDTGPVATDPVATVTLVEGGSVDPPEAPAYRYGGVALYESLSGPAEVAAAWSGRGREGTAPHGPYRNVFEHPEAWPPPAAEPVGAPWVSHWRPIGSLRRDHDR